MGTVTREGDGDNLVIDNENTRLIGINTDESNAVRKERNTESGKDASDFLHTIAPVGTEVESTSHGRGAFGRRLSGVKLLANGDKVDAGLVILDNAFSAYTTDRGIHPDPEQHDIYKEYFSDAVPFNYADKRPRLSNEEMESTAASIKAFQDTKIAFSEGTASRDELDTAMANAYGENNKVAAYRYQLRDWDRAFDISKMDGSDRMAFEWANQSQANKDKYDSAMRQSHTSGNVNPEKSQGFWRSLWSNTETMFSDMNDFAVISRQIDLNTTRRHGSKERDLADDELVKGVDDPAIQAVLLQEAVEYGDDAALLRKDMYLDGLARKEVIADMPLAVQIATAIPAVLASPASIIPGATLATGAVRTGRTIDAVMAVGRIRNLRIPAKLAVGAVAGGTETAIAAIPRIVTDDSFTAEDMKNEIIFGTALGGLIPAAILAGKAGTKRMKKHNAQLKEVQKKLQAEQAITTPVPKTEPQVKTGLPPETVDAPDVAGHNDPAILSPTVDPEEAAILTVKGKESRQVQELHSELKMDNMVDNAVVVPWVNKFGDAVTGVGGAMQSFTQTMLQSTSRVANIIGDKILELPQGFGGDKIRPPSATLMQHSIKTRYLSETQPEYHKLVGQYATEGGHGKVKKFLAQHGDENNTIANNFSRDVAEVIEARRQGRVPKSTSPSVLKMVDTIENSMIKMFDDQVAAGITGFKQGKRIKNYWPQLWNPSKVISLTKQHGEDVVQQVLAKGYLMSKHNDINSMAEAMHTADKFVKEVLDETNTLDYAMPSTVDSRARTRLDIDSTAEVNGISVMDLMDTDVSTVMAKYSNRAAGSVAVSKATGGQITSDLDWSTLRSRMELDGGTADDLQLFDDAQNIVYGRPTRDGLDFALREVKDAIAQSKMGGLGMAQLAEAGAVMARTVRFLVSDPKVFKKIWGMAGESVENVQLMRETQALAGISNEVHLLDRQAVHLDQAKLAEIGLVRKAVNAVATKLSFGAIKAPAGYVLGQGSGFNMIRRFERRVTNASFLMDTAKHFKDGTGKMGAARLRDIGLDPDSPELKAVFRDVVEYDEFGIVKKLNLDKWDAQTREAYHYAMYRDDATMVQQTLGGEAPAWVNKPNMALLAQFKQMAIVANKKSTQRNIQFADKEAMYGLVMNMAMAGMTRTAKFATLGGAAYLATGNESELNNPLDAEYLDPEKYVTQFGFFADMGHIAAKAYELASESNTTYADAGAAIAGEVPMLDWAKDYYTVGAGPSNEDRADAVKSVMLLGNMQFTDTLVKALEEQLD